MLESGSRLGNYQIEALLGQGGMGVVYEAVQLSLSRRVALKVIAPELSRNERFQERFRREGRSQAALDHPNVVTVHDFGETDGHLYISMQLIRGPSLKELIHRGELDLGRVQRILRPIADALDTAHEDGLVHRDFKPQNILVGSRDHAYLADFGLTQALGEPGLTRTGQFVGTLDYIAPEQIHGKPATRRSDVYAFGAVLFECLTGKVPYPRESDAAILFAHVSEPLPRVSELRPGAPPTIDEVLNHALAKNPDERLPTATAVMDELAEAIGGAQLRGAAADHGTAARAEGLDRRPPAAAAHGHGQLRHPRPGKRGRDRGRPSPERVEGRPTPGHTEEPPPDLGHAGDALRRARRGRRRRAGAHAGGQPEAEPEAGGHRPRALRRLDRQGHEADPGGGQGAQGATRRRGPEHPTGGRRGARRRSSPPRRRACRRSSRQPPTPPTTRNCSRASGTPTSGTRPWPRRS